MDIKRPQIQTGCFVDLLYFIALLILILCGMNYIRTGSFTMFGYKILRIASESMEPTLMTGDFVIAKQVKIDDEIHVGEIYTYIGENGLYTVTHRVVGEEKLDGEPFYIFKGDNNQEKDPISVSRTRIKYIVLFI